MTTSANKTLSVAAVVKFQSRSVDEAFVYRWRLCNDQGRWTGAPEVGFVQELNVALTGTNREILLLLPGDKIVTQSVTFSTKERKHLRRMIPFEFEDDVTSEVDDLHFALGEIADDEVNVAYTDKTWLHDLLEELQANDIEVSVCTAEPLVLPRLERGWSLRWSQSRNDQDDVAALCQLDVHYGAQLGFTITEPLARSALDTLCALQPMPEHLLLIAEDQTHIEKLRELLPERLQQSMADVQIDTQLGDEWDSLSLAHDEPLNLRQGEFARRLPFDKWWRDWRSVAAVALVAVIAYVAVNVGQIQKYKSAQAQLLDQQMAVTREVIPQGQIADPEQQIEAQLAKYRTTSSGTQVVALLAKMAPVIANAQNISLMQLNYNNQRGEMHVTLEADSFASIEKLRGDLNNKQLQVDPPSSSSRGDKYQARMVVRRSSP